MDQIFTWAQNHQVAATAIGGIVCIVLYALPNDGIKMLGFRISQLIRHFPVVGPRLEKLFDEKVRAFFQGTESDNQK